MSKPKLLIIAGCNGSGKSSFSKAFARKDLVPFDYDRIFKEKYESLIVSDFRDVMAHNLARLELETQIENAIKNKLDFCYETNFNTTPLYWAKLFKKSNFRIEIVFFCLDSIHKAKERVKIRFENGGHFVPDKEVEERYKLGYQNLNKNYIFFDSINLFETSLYNSTPKHFLTIEKNKLILLDYFPKYLGKLIPNIKKIIA